MKVRKTGCNQGKPGISDVDQVKTRCKPVWPKKWSRKIGKTDENQVFTWPKVAEISGPSATKNQVFTMCFARFSSGKTTRNQAFSRFYSAKNQVKCRQNQGFRGRIPEGVRARKNQGKTRFFRPDPPLVLSDRKTPGFLRLSGQTGFNQVFSIYTWFLPVVLQCLVTPASVKSH